MLHDERIKLRFGPHFAVRHGPKGFDPQDTNTGSLDTMDMDADD
jgi:hypothetical protein